MLVVQTWHKEVQSGKSRMAAQCSKRVEHLLPSDCQTDVFRRIPSVSQFPDHGSLERTSFHSGRISFVSTEVRAEASFGHNRSSSSVSHLARALAVGPDTQTDPSRIKADKNDVLEQLGIQRLGGKDKKELRASAHGLGTRLNVQQVGKLGVSQTVVKSISDALEANEILKVKVLDNCSSDMSEIITELEKGTRGQVFGKLAAAEKRPEKPRPRRK